METGEIERPAARRQIGTGILAGALLCFGFLTGFTIGLPFFVLGVGMTVWIGLRSRLRGWTALWGLTTGIALVLLFIGLIHIGDHPCQGDSGSGHLPPGVFEDESACGGFNPVPWLIASGWMGAVSWLGYRLTRRR